MRSRGSIVSSALARCLMFGLTLGLMLGSPVALHAEPAPGPASAGVTADYTGEQSETWDQPPSRAQAERDTELIPVGKGALFVPAMTDPAAEPKYIVERDGQVVETLATGRKAVLEPGIYTVRIGSGALTDRFVRRVLVKEGRTTIVPATWSGLVVDVVDERSVPFRGSYELVRLPARTNIGIGLGADVELGEGLRTWLLEPGNYMLIKTGESYQARRDFYTFRLLPGELRQLSLVLDRDDGTFLGAGARQLGDQDTEVQDWKLHLVLGGDAELNRRSDLVGFANGYGFTLGGYLDFVAQYKPEKHLVYTRLKVEEKQVKFPDQPFQKDLDELRLDALYVYRVLPWLGPYVRFGTQTTLFPGYVNFDSDTRVTQLDADGGVVKRFEADDQFELAKPFAPIELKAGLGLSVIQAASYIFDVNVRLGFGSRLLFNRGLFNAAGGVDPEYEDAYTVTARDDAFQYGIELTLVGSLRLTRWILATTEFEFLEPFDDYKNPVIDWDTTLGFRISSFASINYIFKLLSDIERSDDLQTEHRVLLRLTWQIL